MTRLFVHHLEKGRVGLDAELLQEIVFFLETANLACHEILQVLTLPLEHLLSGSNNRLDV